VVVGVRLRSACSSDRRATNRDSLHDPSGTFGGMYSVTLKPRCNSLGIVVDICALLGSRLLRINRAPEIISQTFHLVRCRVELIQSCGSCIFEVISEFVQSAGSVREKSVLFLLRLNLNCSGLTLINRF
jgi:hypothetical protein